ncbi:uncharacterized protein LOC112664407 isoform X1 [Canis lupus dingo]|uniref:uncharacterized protein LOC112664407 isoform X1 n=1 Tax=Canis lupus dingo TaxID=286419 RepID=UPI0020C59401|nr:uncharacterized protein LOC112664407 isoform X1 [Canis lupus dingo]
MCGGLSALGLELQPQQDPGGPDARRPVPAVPCASVPHALLCGLVDTLPLAIFLRVSSLPKTILLLVLTASYILVLELSGYTRASGGNAVSGLSFEPIMAILLFSCTLALHARQVNIKLRLDYLWTAQARDLISHTECLPSVESALRSGDKCHLVTRHGHLPLDCKAKEPLSPPAPQPCLRGPQGQSQKSSRPVPARQGLPAARGLSWLLKAPAPHGPSSLAGVGQGRRGTIPSALPDTPDPLGHRWEKIWSLCSAHTQPGLPATPPGLPYKRETEVGLRSVGGLSQLVREQTWACVVWAQTPHCALPLGPASSESSGRSLAAKSEARVQIQLCPLPRDPMQMGPPPSPAGC